MSSISSSRKNRPNDARDSDYYELVGDFSSAVNDFLEAQGRPKSVMSPADYARQRVRHMVDDDESAESADTYALYIQPLADGETMEITLDESGCVPAGTKVRRADPPVYSWLLTSDSDSKNVTSDRVVRFEGDGPIDITQSVPLSQDEVRQVLREISHAEAERQRLADMPPPAPTYKRLSRSDVSPDTSFLPVVLNPILEPKDIRITAYEERNIWFNVCGPKMIGGLKVIANFPHDENREIRVVLLDPTGRTLLETAITKRAASMASRNSPFWRIEVKS